MATQRPQVAGYVSREMKGRITRLREDQGVTESKIVEYCVETAMPKLEQAVKRSRGPFLIGLNGSPHKPQSR